MAGVGKEYIIGRGRVLFDMFVPGTFNSTGERYFGNTPDFSISQNIETLDHFDADEGLNVKDESITLEQSQIITFTTDNIDGENLALWFAGSLENVTIASATGKSETFVANLDRYFFLGKGDDTPSGVRNVTNVVITDETGENPVTIAAQGNYVVDAANGSIYILPNAADIEAGKTYKVTYDLSGNTRQVIIAKGQQVRGSLRFLSQNPVGKQRHHFYPYVKLTANGDYALKGSEWQQMSFTAEVLKRDANTKTAYIDVL